MTITVTGENDPPFVALPLGDQGAVVGELFSFMVPAGSFDDIDMGDVLSLSASLPGGEPLPLWLGFDGTTFSGTPGAEDLGPVTLEVTATDLQGAMASDQFQVTVAAGNQDPVAQDDAFGVLENGMLAGDVLLDNGGGIDDDPDGDPLTVDQVNGGAANVGPGSLFFGVARGDSGSARGGAPGGAASRGRRDDRGLRALGGGSHEARRGVGRE